MPVRELFADRIEKECIVCADVHDVAFTAFTVRRSGGADIDIVHTSRVSSTSTWSSFCPVHATSMLANTARSVAGPQ